MNTLTTTVEHRHASVHEATAGVVAAARRIGRSGMTLEDLKVLHAYRDLTLNYEHHVAVHELRESEHVRSQHLSDDADELARLRAREAEEAEEAGREQEAGILPVFDPMGIDLRFDDMLDHSGLSH